MEPPLGLLLRGSTRVVFTSCCSLTVVGCIDDQSNVIGCGWPLVVLIITRDRCWFLVVLIIGIMIVVVSCRDSTGLGVLQRDSTSLGVLRWFPTGIGVCGEIRLSVAVFR